MLGMNRNDDMNLKNPKPAVLELPILCCVHWIQGDALNITNANFE